MMMRAVVLTAILFAPAAEAAAQVPARAVRVEEITVPAPRPTDRFDRPVAVRRDSVGSDAAAALFSAFGWVAGAYAGFNAARLIQPSAGDSYIGPPEWWVGALIGSSLGAAAGAWIGHGMKGNLPGAMLGSLLAVPVVGVVALVLPPALFALPAAQITISVVVSRPPRQVNLREHSSGEQGRKNRRRPSVRNDCAFSDIR